MAVVWLNNAIFFAKSWVQFSCLLLQKSSSIDILAQFIEKLNDKLRFGSKVPARVHLGCQAPKLWTKKAHVTKLNVASCINYIKLLRCKKNIFICTKSRSILTFNFMPFMAFVVVTKESDIFSLKSKSVRTLFTSDERLKSTECASVRKIAQNAAQTRFCQV
jgi:hypothetical protein